MQRIPYQLKVLIVDDSLLLRERLACHLGKIDGVTIAGKASDVREGIETFKRLSPDVVVLDLQLPDGTGIDVLELIKHDQPSTVVMVLTNHPLLPLRKRCTDAGAEYFFDKTREFGRVSEVLRDIIRRRSTSALHES
jgi:DNA-binding NarL/FixJ family response regulator